MASSTKWRVNVTSVQGGSFVALTEIEMHTAVSGSDVCTGGTALASSEFDASLAATKAFDDDNNSIWANGGGTTGWIQYEFASPVDIVEYSLRVRNDGAVNQSPITWTFEYWDGSQYVVVDTRSEATWSASERRVFAVAGAGAGAAATFSALLVSP